jgi:hypothetical protein
MIRAAKRKTPTPTKVAKLKGVSRRPAIPTSTERAVLLANRHSCCVCQKPRVQIHHIDSDSSNNDASNLATLCTDHHDLATMTIGLTKKLKPIEVRTYKAEWEERCRNDVLALSRKRFTFYYCIYKNPQRLLGAYASLSDSERKSAVERIRGRLVEEESEKKADKLFGMNAVPRMDPPTLEALKSIYNGEGAPSYVDASELNFDPAQQYASQSHYFAYHKYDLWCQVMGQTIAEARGAIPLEDLYKFKTAREIDAFEGSLVTYRLTVRGKGVRIPRLYVEHPTATLQAKSKSGGQTYAVKMQIRTRDQFSDTSAINLAHGRVSGLALLHGALKSKGEIQITLVPLLIGAGGRNLYPEKYT